MSTTAPKPIDLPWRDTPEWIGKTPDSAVPKAVKLRVFHRFEGRCYLSGIVIRAGDDWDVEHIKPLRSAVPGEPHLNREGNLAPALRDKHREKTAAENSDGAKADRIRAKALGIWPKSKRPLKGRGFEPSRRKASHNIGEPHEGGLPPSEPPTPTKAEP